MSIDLMIGLVLVLAVLVYLAYSLLLPERF